MRIRALKYSLPFILFAGAWHSFTVTGWQVWLPLAWAWVAIPLLELFIKPSEKNLSAAEEEMAKADKTYDLLLYAAFVFQYALLIKFLYVMTNDTTMQWYDVTGRIWVMGLLCGVFGINVGHELGHRANKVEQWLAKMLLLTSQYMHFFIEHNKGHHKKVSTPEDPSSARYNEWVYVFYFRSVLAGYISAWKIANQDTRKKNTPVFSMYNEMIQFTLLQIVFITALFFLCGWLTTLYYLMAAGMGILLLETVNYIEHYGLQRRKMEDGKYERAIPAHSWNSNHALGRLFLFELSRHSDHHYLASRKYQVLRHHDDSPQMPTGYPGMMILSLIPPAWFLVMNKKIKQLT